MVEFIYTDEALNRSDLVTSGLFFEIPSELDDESSPIPIPEHEWNWLRERLGNPKQVSILTNYKPHSSALDLYFEQGK